MANTVTDRIDVRISKEQKELFKYASELSGFKSLTEFVVYCINSEASKILNENNILLKSLEDKKIFINALLNPPVPNDKLKKAQLTYNEFKKNGTIDRIT
jgi:uncharacterized protein (DUF1778 family)